MVKIISFILVLLEIYSLKTYLRIQNNNNLTDSNESDNRSEDIIILHTNDVHCGINDNIGYDGLMLYKKELQKKYKYVLLVDVGDHIQGDIIGLLSEGLDIITIMNKIGYNVSIIGNHEFDYGIEQLYECEKQLECGYISSNFCYRKNKTTIFRPYEIIEVGNIKIGFIGVTTPQTLTKTPLHKIVDETGNMIYDFLTENDGNELYNKVQQYIDELKQQEINYMIILDHFGNEGTESTKYTSSILLSHISGVNAMIDGHTHKEYNYTSKDKDGKDIHLAQTGTKLSNIGLLKIKTNGEIISEMIKEVPEPEEKEGAEKLIRNGIERWVDIEMKNFIINLAESHNDQLNEVIGHIDFDLIINTDPYGDYHKQISRSEESPLGNLITDSIRYNGETDISIMCAGSIRADLMKGDITYKDILRILPFSSEIIVKEITGQDLLDALECGMRFLPGKSSKFLQVSGVSFSVNISINSTVEVDENEMFVRVKGERRVSNVKVGEEELVLNKTYTISFDNYIGEGGDGYSMFSKYETILDALVTDNQALKIYILDGLKGNISDYYKKTQGRIIINSPIDDKTDNKTDNKTNNNSDDKTENNNNFLTNLLIIIIVSLVIIFIIVILLIIRMRKKEKNILNDINSSNLNTNLVQELSE